MVEAGVKLCVLGVFEAWIQDRQIALGQPKRQALLALLALRWNTLVTTSEIIDALWDTSPPPRARNQIQVYVAGLRRVLASAGVPGGGIETISGAYRLNSDMVTVDLAEFDERLVDARSHLEAGDLFATDRSLCDALTLWRGPAFVGIPGDFFAAAAHRLEERRMLVLEQRLRVKLEMGHFSELISDLHVAVANHPLREGLRYGLMIALYRSGRTAEALASYREGRRATVDELGVEPGPELRSLEQLILRGEPAPPGFEPLLPVGLGGGYR